MNYVVAAYSIIFGGIFVFTWFMFSRQKQLEKKLNDLGIFHYWQIAGLGPEAAHKIGEEVGLPGRVEAWIAQSKELTAE